MKKFPTKPYMWHATTWGSVPRFTFLYNVQSVVPLTCRLGHERCCDSIMCNLHPNVHTDIQMTVEARLGTRTTLVLLASKSHHSNRVHSAPASARESVAAVVSIEQTHGILPSYHTLCVECFAEMGSFGGCFVDCFVFLVNDQDHKGYDTIHESD